jgi:cardiolipin synthase
MVIDSQWATIGSTNLDRRSFSLNDELNLVVYDRAVAQRLEQVFVADREQSRRVTYEEWRNRSLLNRFLEVLAIPIKDQL